MNDDLHPTLDKDVFGNSLENKVIKSENSVEGSKDAGSRDLSQKGENNPPKSQNKKDDKGFDNKAMPFSGLEPEDKKLYKYWDY